VVVSRVGGDCFLRTILVISGGSGRVCWEHYLLFCLMQVSNIRGGGKSLGFNFMDTLGLGYCFM
jgi:hypothetical protein